MTAKLKEKHKFHKMTVELAQVDPGLSGEPFKIAAILLASAVVGPNVGRIKSFTRYPITLIKKVSKRMRENGVWKNGRLYVDWMDKKNGGAAFWMDVCVAQGYMKRAGGNEEQTAQA